MLNLYGFLSVLLSVGLCVWAWRKGETYAGWMALGFAPLHLAYPFAALRTATELRVDVIREGQPLSLRLAVAD